MIQIIVSVILCVLSFTLGWFLSKKFFCVKELLETLSICTKLLAGEIPSEEALKQIRKVTGKLNKNLGD